VTFPFVDTVLTLSMDARVRFALINVDLAVDSRVSWITDTIPSVDAILAGTVDAGVRRTLINVNVT